MNIMEGFNRLLESSAMLEKVDMNKMPFEDQLNFATYVMEFNKAAANLDKGVRMLIVKAMAVGAIKE